MADAPWLYIHWLSWTLWLHVTLGLLSLWFIVIERVLMIVSVSYELLISNLKLKDFNAYHSNIHCIISLCVDNKADAMKPNPNLINSMRHRYLLLHYFIQRVHDHEATCRRQRRPSLVDVNATIFHICLMPVKRKINLHNLWLCERVCLPMVFCFLFLHVERSFHFTHFTWWKCERVRYT